jgi:hypothetical protein
MEKAYLFGEKMPQSRAEIIDNYVKHFTERDRTYASSIMQQFTDPTLPLARTQVLIPVAAHQESGHIANTLTQYAEQQTNQPFTVILSLNSPAGEVDNPNIAQTQAAIEASRRQHPNLDVRYATSFYEQPTIGMIRRDLWNGALLASLEQGDYLNEVDEIIGINHDIDAVSISPRYIQRVQAHYQSIQSNLSPQGRAKPLPIASTDIRHALSPTHPTISKGILWTDFTARQTGVSYEAGYIFPFSHYAQQGGFDTAYMTHESYPLYRDTTHISRIPGTALQTSPRRYIERLPYGYDSIWSDATFGANDTCRDEAITRPDISLNQLENIIDAKPRLTQVVQSMSIAAIRKHTSDQNELIYIENTADAHDRKIQRDVATYSHATIHLAAEVLSRVIESPNLAAKVRSLHSDAHFHEKLDRLFINQAELYRLVRPFK